VVLKLADQKNLESFEMWCQRRMEISWTDRVKNEEVLQRVKEEKNIPLTILNEGQRRNCLLKRRLLKER
jgi:hypothetical protein